MPRDVRLARIAAVLDELAGDPVRVVLGVRAWWRRVAAPPARPAAQHAGRVGPLNAHRG